MRDGLKSRGVKYFFGAYVDIRGVPKSKCVLIDHLESALNGSERRRGPPRGIPENGRGNASSAVASGT